MNAQLWVFTRRQGLLSRVGHDLQLSVAAVPLQVDGTHIHATILANNITVVGAMKGAQLDPRSLSARDRADILKSLRQTILDVPRHPEITFSGQYTTAALEGEVTVRGRRRPVRLPWISQDTSWRAEGSLDHRDFGIPPFSALMGTLRVDPQVRIRVQMPPLP